MIIIPIIVGVIALVLFFVATYKVVGPNEAHVVIFMGRGRKFYGPTVGKKSAYFFIPVIMKRDILPLTNVKMSVENIELNDLEVAPFMCDVITWVRIADPVLAAERLNISQGAFQSLQSDLINIVQAIARAASMKQEILDIMRDRKSFAEAVSEEVRPVLGEWGVALVNLEVNEIRDAAESTVIADYESIRAAKIRTNARIEIAERNKEAIVVEQANFEESQIATAKAQEAAEKRFVEKDRVVEISKQEQERDVATATEAANEQKVSALNTLEVGKARVARDATIEVATGDAEAVRIKGEKEADVVRLRGEADGAAIAAKGTAEAVAKDKMAEAMKKFNDAATTIEKIAAWKEVEQAKYEALGEALSKADLKLVSSGEGGNIFGFPLNASTGADIAQMIEAAGGIEELDSAIDALTKEN